MEIFIAVCLGLITLELGVIVAAILVAVFRVHRIAQAAEVLVYRVDQEIEYLGSTMRSGWMRTLGAVANFAGGWWSSRRKH